MDGRHIGIRLRISIPAGPLLEADSDMLHYMARFGEIEEPCEFDCRPGGDKHGWRKILSPEVFSGPALTIEIKPAELPDEYPGD